MSAIHQNLVMGFSACASEFGWGGESPPPTILLPFPTSTSHCLSQSIFLSAPFPHFARFPPLTLPLTYPCRCGGGNLIPFYLCVNKCVKAMLHHFFFFLTGVCYKLNDIALQSARHAVSQVRYKMSSLWTLYLFLHLLRVQAMERGSVSARWKPFSQVHSTACSCGDEL